jgi:uncharacterized membrane protein YgdD (TMEM256/DUF423 family)
LVWFVCLLSLVKRQFAQKRSLCKMQVSFAYRAFRKNTAAVPPNLSQSLHCMSLYLTGLAALNGFSAVLLGALGAHALHDRLDAGGALQSWQVASTYHLVHAIGILSVLIWAQVQPAREGRLRLVGKLWLAGCVLFAGSIYALSLGGPRALGPVTPLGGLAFLAGWGLLALEGFKKTDRIR